MDNDASMSIPHRLHRLRMGGVYFLPYPTAKLRILFETMHKSRKYFHFTMYFLTYRKLSTAFYTPDIQMKSLRGQAERTRLLQKINELFGRLKKKN